jgi:hypothetical protein
LSRPFGESEIADMIPLADAVNKLATDMMVTSEYHAMPRRWATGIEVPPSDRAAGTASTRRSRNSLWDAYPGKTWLGGKGTCVRAVRRGDAGQLHERDQRC